MDNRTGYLQKLILITEEEKILLPCESKQLGVGRLPLHSFGAGGLQCCQFFLVFSATVVGHCYIILHRCGDDASFVTTPGQEKIALFLIGFQITKKLVHIIFSFCINLKYSLLSFLNSGEL